MKRSRYLIERKHYKLNTNTNQTANAMAKSEALKTIHEETLQPKAEDVKKINKQVKSNEQINANENVFESNVIKSEQLGEPQKSLIVMSRQRLNSLSKAKMIHFKGPTEPDPETKRDIDNASPEAKEICNKYPCHYCIYIYSRPVDVDEDTYLFRRQNSINDLKKKSSLESDDQELNQMPVLLPDRRISSIEIKTDCKFYLGSLKGNENMKRGLPRRLLTIAGPTFSNIIMAINMLENQFARIMQYAMYPYRLPSSLSTIYTSNDFLTVNYNDFVSKQMSTIGLVKNIDDKYLSRYAYPKIPNCPDQASK